MKRKKDTKAAPVIFDGLRLGLQHLDNRDPEGLVTLAAVSGVGIRKIRRFMNGDDAALLLWERASLEALQ